MSNKRGFRGGLFGWPFRARCGLALGALVALAAPAGATELTVEVLGVPDSTGNVLIAACAVGTPFPAGPCTYVATAAAHAGAVVLKLRDLPGGRYALSAFHDRDNNQKLGQSWIGIPTECIAFGNDAPVGRFGPPAFDSAAVAVPVIGASKTAITLRCR